MKVSFYVVLVGSVVSDSAGIDAVIFIATIAFVCAYVETIPLIAAILIEGSDILRVRDDKSMQREAVNLMRYAAVRRIQINYQFCQRVW